MRPELQIKLTPKQLAEAFCEMNDERQAQFFIECAAIAETWTGGMRGWQWSSVGGHLRECECSTDAAREMVAAIAAEAQP